MRYLVSGLDEARKERTLKVFLSGTTTDLKAERFTATEILRSLSFDCFASEYEGSVWNSAAASCLAELRACDIYVGIYGGRYGFVPPRHEPFDIFDGQRSITHIEFAIARRLRKPALIYIQASSAIEPEQERFLADVRHFFSGLFVSTFDETTELGLRIKSDVIDLITQLVRGEYRADEETLPRVQVYRTASAMYSAAAELFLQTVERNPWPCISVSAGRTTAGVFTSLVNHPRLASSPHLDRLSIVAQTEYIGYGPDNNSSCRSHITQSLLARLPGSREHDAARHIFLPGYLESGNFDSACREIDAMLAQRIIHLALLGISPSGEVLCIGPHHGPPAQLLDQATSIISMDTASLQHLTPQPAIPYVVTLGLRNLLERSERIVLVAEGQRKAEVMFRLCYGPITAEIPGTLLRLHRELLIMVDEAAARLLPETAPHGNIVRY